MKGNQEILNKIDNITTRLSNGENIDPEEVKSLLGFPSSILVTQYAKDNTCQKFIDIARVQNPNSLDKDIFSFILLLLRSHIDNAKVREVLFDLWGKYENHPEYRSHLLWCILDNPDLKISCHRKLYDFVMKNLETFLQESIKWSGGEDKILEHCRARLQDETTPRTKYWAYLCRALVASNSEEAKSLIEEYQSSEILFVKEVANELIIKLNSEKISRPPVPE